jgi:nickel/cobalt transporter (NicO) family protein
MNSFSDYLARGNAWLYIPAAIVLGALHGLEPGHSKTMMAAFIVAIRGTVWQALLLGVSATVSHTALIWVLAFVGLHYSGKFAAEDVEPYLQAGTGIIVIAMAAWMFWRIRRMQRPTTHGPHGGPVLKTDDGLLEVSVFEEGIPPRFRIYFYDKARLAIAPPADVRFTCETTRAGGVTQAFQFKPHGAYLEATDELPEPHEFDLKCTLRSGEGVQTLATRFAEEHEHSHGHEHPHGHAHPHEHENTHRHDFENQDEHERAHAREWQQRFANRDVTTGQLLMFGLTGGLIPCPSAFAVLLVCLQLKRFALGFAIVLAFSLGLAITLVTVGSLAALSVKHATKRFAGLHKLAAKMPYASAALMTLIGILITIQGLRTILH